MKNKNSIGTIFSIFFLLILTAGIVYTAISIYENDKKCPFIISKITTISTASGEQKGYQDANWTLSLSQSNDIFVYIEKNKEINQNHEEIKKVTIENFKVLNSAENAKIELSVINSVGNIPNSAGLRQVNKDITEYAYTGTELVQDGKLLQTAGVTLDKLIAEITLDVIVESETQKYKANVNVTVPAKDLLEQGKGVTDITPKNIVFEEI